MDVFLFNVMPAFGSERCHIHLSGLEKVLTTFAEDFD